jgi:hypothetical protein
VAAVSAIPDLSFARNEEWDERGMGPGPGEAKAIANFKFEISKGEGRNGN